MTEDEEERDYERRVTNSRARAAIVAQELQDLAVWLTHYTGGTVRVDEIGFVDELLDGYQQNDPDFDFTDSIRREAIFEIVSKCKNPSDILTFWIASGFVSRET